ncbi:hypothetical protein O6H91_05G086900 [Diphasiastrum complanatum]|uniref:Uncharacterized protein n=1 Tax=Diphasiastrum complanatum TaxID=34168 RepID=A0ACC2DQF6_DIPCM|nr:hypothetical protein O6H91_05G086900 [Diphasiastrum complanatum]
MHSTSSGTWANSKLALCMKPLDWAPYANDGDAFRHLPPMGITYSLSTDDIQGAQISPAIRKYFHPPVGDKMFPSTWISQDMLSEKKPFGRFITPRVVNPLDPDYTLPSGESLIPCGEQIFSNRVTDLLDTSDIPGTKAKSLYKRSLRTCIEDLSYDMKTHPAKRTFIRTRISIGQGLELFDINIGKKKFGFQRSSVTNPLEPLYPTEKEETPEQKYIRLKSKVIAPRRHYWNAGDTVVEKLLDKMYWKAEKLPSMCRKYSSSKGRITYDQLRKSLEQFGVVYSDEEFEKLLSHVDKAGMGFVQYQNLSRMLKHVDGLERVLTRRLGFDDDKALGHRSSLGQGVQVLVDALHRGKRTWMGCKSQEQIYNLFSGVLKDDLLLNSIREPVSFSYAEQAAALSSTKNQLNFGSFKPGAAFWVTKQASPIHASDSNFSQQACASNEGSSMKQLLSTVAKDVLGQPTANMVNQGSPSQKAPSPKPDDAGQQHQNQDGKDSNTQDYQFQDAEP